MNPELRKYLWLEFNTKRLFAMPIMLGTIFLTAVFIKDLPFGLSGLDSDTVGIGWVAPAIAFMLTFIWGTRLVAESIIQEVITGTWKMQSMSAVSPAKMALGKIFGSTSYIWYGNIFCMLFYVLQSRGVFVKLGETFVADKPVFILFNILVFFLTGVIAHAVSMIVSIDSLLWRQKQEKKDVMFYQLSGIAVAFFIFKNTIFGLTAEKLMSTVYWYGNKFTFFYFVIISLLFLAVWCIIGACHMMKLEMRRENTPYIWLLFVFSSITFITGVLPSQSALMSLPVPSGLLMAFYFVIGSVYLVALGEPKDAVRFRRLKNYVKKHDYKRAGTLLPRSLITLPICGLLAVLLIVLARKPMLFNPFGPSPEDIVRTMRYSVAAAFLFVIRDVSFIFLMSMLDKSRQGGDNVIAVICLLVSYTVIPAVLLLFNADILVSAFLPYAQEEAEFIVAPVIAEVVTLLMLISYRWKVNTMLDAKGPEKLSKSLETD